MRRLHREEGVTLVELLVTIVVTGVVLASLTGAVLTVTRSTASTDQREEDRGVAMIAIGQATQALRTAHEPAGVEGPFLHADAERVTFYGNIGGDVGDPPARVTIESVETDEGHALEMTTVPGDPSGGSLAFDEDDASTRRLVGRLTNPDDLFVLHPDATSDAPFTPAPDDPNSLRAIRAISVEVAVGGAEHLDVAPTRVTNRVRLPNLEG
ncbi:type II secretion system protein [Egibacter rhizosphaerae]|nr:type II secretion system protein [Egibacter rhizosphaerae]